MANQIVVSSGAKVRDLNDVIIGTSGVLSSLAFNVANGVPKLDVNGKILVSQLPNSVMEYKGTWDASTNTPTLVNGTGNQGDVYLCNVAGTVNFGAGAIAFFVGDQVIYSGTIWQRASGATGTVTSVGLTSTGNDAITITGSPITTSGNINLGFAGTNLQYINGAGDLTNFPTLITSIGLSMPSAFNVSNSPLTANGTIGVTGAGVASQYIRGDGTLADFPTSGGGGSSVSYYLNGGTSQGTIGGVTYYEMSKTADTGTMADFSLTGNGFIVAFLTDAGDPAQLNIPAGNWNYEIYASMSANGGTPEMYAELYKYDGTTFTLIATSPHEILYDGTALNLYTFAMTVPSTTLAITDRLAVKLYATNSGGKTTTVHTQDSHLCQIITTFSTGITALNGLTAQVQYFATGTSGTDFNISSTTATHTFNIPSASATNRGLITTGTQTIAGDKTFSGSIILNGGVDMNNSLNVNSGFFIRNNVIGSTLYTSFSINKASNIETVQFLYSTGFASNLLFNDAATYSYSFPTASGTIALTSNLSSYVPYTGATTDLNLGLFNLFANALNTQSLEINTIGGGSAPINFYMSSVQKASISASLSTLTFSAKNTNGFQFQNPSNAIIFSISNTGVLGNGTYSYTLPSATGTLALTSDIPSLANYVTLNGTQTISGNKTFSGINSFTNYTSFSYASTFMNGTSLNWTAAGSHTAGSLTLSSAHSGSTSSLILSDGDTAKYIYFSFTNTATGTKTYTLPDASGTLALTSDLGSYLPLTGGTLTGQLYINPTNTATVGLDVASNTTRFRSDNLEGFKRQLTIGMSSGTVINMIAQGYGGTYGTDLAFYTSSASGVNGSPAMYITGGNKIGILNGTPSATFDVTGSGAFSTSIQSNNSLDNYAFKISPAGTDLYGIYANSSSAFSIRKIGVADYLTISSTGLASFSSTVATTGVVFPATQVSSSDPNTLDDYEEGSWTPTYGNSSTTPSYITQFGIYTKIGRVVNIVGKISASNLSGGAAIVIQGLPFAGANTVDAGQRVSLRAEGDWTGFNSLFSTTCFRINNSDFVGVRDSGGSSIYAIYSAYGGTLSFNFSATYYV